MLENFIPHYIEGKQNDLEYIRSFERTEAAISCFKRAGSRLFRPAVWHELCGLLSAQFELVKDNGEPVQSITVPGTFIKIDIPGPGPSQGEGFDWVEVVALKKEELHENDTEAVGMRLEPCPNPHNDNPHVAHFFEKGASSTFILQRSGSTVKMSYHGRNEQPNTHTSQLRDNIRNTIIAAGAALGLSEAQWYALIKAFLDD